MSAAAARIPAPPQAIADPFGARAPKLAALLGVPRSGRVLAAGGRVEAWRGDLQAYFATVEWTPRIDPAAIAGPLDLVLWAPGAVETGDGFGPALAALRRALGDGGSLVLLAKNRLSLREMAHRGPAAGFASGSRTSAGYRAALRSAGFGRVDEFHALPSLDEPEEFASARAPLAVASTAPRVERMLAGAGILRHLHDGAAFIASGEHGGVRPLLDLLAAGIAGCVRPVLERFDLRQRGSLLLLVRDPAAGRLACRVASGEAAALIGRNAEWTRRIHRSADLRDSARALVPAPLAELPIGEATAYVERAMDGVVGWKLAPAARAVLSADLVRFARDLGHDTSHTVVLGAFELDRVLPDRFPPAGAALAGAYGEVHRALARRVEGTPRVLAWAHGDFGYGNALADARTGRLRAVIDWDQAGEDAAGTDLLNFAAHARLIDRGEPLPTAFADVARRFVRDGFAGMGAPEMDAWLPPTHAARAELAAWTGLRIALRSARYPAMFAASREIIAALLDAAGRALAESPAPAEAAVA